ncbi:predicted protein [Aspergillus terreus NIH2624]|uniref:Protein kinase domain-containing protein n=1 Tax=Aspergillus terreus (strain NIH 2624 / FGSC A1156) TaxID=341663 RepID=Q0CIT6_ASPTN|nr:uncharacterized protein ATEG_06398 [Aspergillus terreus NIH2624]EAU32942.1 predicted protein [Aspergillus terreus NIH2624]
MSNVHRAPEVILRSSGDYKVDIWNMVGPRPPEFREQRPLSSAFWDESGNWKDVAPIPDITLESLGEEVEGEDKEGFLRWLRMALQWSPEDRPTALELLFDE